MIPASQASRRAAPGLMVFAGVEVGCLEPAHQGVEGHGDHDGGVESAGLGEASWSGSAGRTRRTPGRAAPGSAAARRAVLGAAWCLGAAIANSAFLSMAPVRVSRVNRPWTLPWPSSHIVSRVAAAAARSSFSSSLASWASAASGRGDLEDRAGPGSSGPWRRGRRRRSSRCASASATSSGSRSSGSSAERAEDDLGLLDVDPAGRPARRGSGRGSRGRGRAAWPGARRRGWCGLVTACQFAVEDGAGAAGDVDAVGVGQEAGLRARRAGPWRTGPRRASRWSRRRPSTRPGPSATEAS